MRTTICNLQSAETHFAEIRRLLASGKYINLSYEIAKAGKTKHQVGFFFKNLCSQVSLYLTECGFIMSDDDVRYGLYAQVAKIVPEMTCDNKIFGGANYIKHIPEMDRAVMSKFISAVFIVIDTNPMFAELRLTPDTRYNWAFHIDKEEIKAISLVEFPDKDDRYLDHIRSLPCIICGKHAPSNVHHLKQNITRGISERSEDFLAMPICHNCHMSLAHNKTDEFYKALAWIPIDIMIFLKLCYQRWLNYN